MSRHRCRICLALLRGSDYIFIHPIKGGVGVLAMDLIHHSATCVSLDTLRTDVASLYEVIRVITLLGVQLSDSIGVIAFLRVNFPRYCPCIVQVQGFHRYKPRISSIQIIY